MSCKTFHHKTQALFINRFVFHGSITSAERSDFLLRSFSRQRSSRQKFPRNLIWNASKGAVVVSKTRKRMATRSSDGDVTVNESRSDSYKRLKDKVCIITGGASGLGESTAFLFASQGAIVIIADVQDRLGADVAAKIGRGATYVHCDVSKEADVAAMVDKCLKQHGRLDVLFNNAAIIPAAGGIADLDMAKFEASHAVNVRGVALGLKYAARAMVLGGSIVNTTSVAATQAPESADAAYTSSKHAVLGLTRAAAQELGPRGIRVNSVAPSTMFTPMVAKAAGANLEMIKGMVEAASVLKVKDGLRVEDVADAALFLASDESRYISGHNLVVDGGLSIRALTLRLPHH